MAGGQGGAGPQPVRVWEAWPGSPPAEPGAGRSAVRLQEGRRDLWVQAPLGLAGGPSPWPANKATTPGVELWELGGKVALGGNESRQPSQGWGEGAGQGRGEGGGACTCAPYG